MNNYRITFARDLGMITSAESVGLACEVAREMYPDREIKSAECLGRSEELNTPKQTRTSPDYRLRGDTGKDGMPGPPGPTGKFNWGLPLIATTLALAIPVLAVNVQAVLYLTQVIGA